MQDWKRRKGQADAESLVPAMTNESQRKKSLSKKPLAPFLHGKRCVRSLKFEHEIDKGVYYCSSVDFFKVQKTYPSHFEKVKTYTLLNIYEVSFNEYEAVLRWGTVDGTSLNGSCLRYPIGNKVAVEYYVGHFKGFYGITSKLVADQVMTIGTAGTGGGKGQPVQRQGSMSSSAGGGHSMDSEDRLSAVTASSYGGNKDQDSSSVHPPTIERRPSSVKLKVKPLRK